MKKLLALILALTLALGTVACGNSAPANDGAAGVSGDPAVPAAEGMQETPDMVLRLSEDQSPDFPTTQGCQKFADLVYERTNGRIKIEVYDSGTLGGTTAVAEQLQYGAIDLLRGGAAPLAQFSPTLNVFSLPFLFTSTENDYKCLDSELAQDILKMEDSEGLIGLAYYTGGARCFYSSQPITCLADLAGMDIRVQESEIMMGMIDALGANPTPTAYAEVYSALQTGVVDAAENGIGAYVSTAHCEVAPYLMLDNHVFTPDMLVMSRQVWDRLSPEDQQIFMEAAYDSVVYEREVYEAYEAEALKKALDSGVTVYELTDDQLQEFIDATAGMPEKYCSQYIDIVNQFKAMQE